jgi:hypothetical protein
MVTRTYAAAEVFTAELQFPAPVHPLTAVQWHIIQSTSFFTLSLGAAAGAVVSFAVPVIGQLLARRDASAADKNNVIISVIISVVLVISGRFADRRRRRIIKYIDKNLLSDSQLGISDD